MGLLRSNVVVSVTLFLLSGLCTSACRQEVKAPRNPAAPPAATAEPSTASAPQQVPSSVSDDPPRSVPVTTPPKEREGEKQSIRSFAVYALSRGKGVPPEAREALLEVQKLVEADQKRGVSVTLETARIGIEGETRLCVDYRDPRDGTRAYARASAIVKGIDLVNLTVESCTAATPETETQKEEES